jgi:hypothetical protein
LETWSSKHDWQTRLAAFNEERDRREQEAWEARRKAVRQADWEAGEALRDLAADILAETVFEKVKVIHQARK